MRKRLLRSRSGFEKPESREEAIMQNILGASNVLEPSESNIEEILKSILYNTPYTKEAEFEIEKILLAIKNNGTYDGECESRDLKILFAILNDLDYTEEAESRIEELFIEWLNQRSKVQVLEGIPPLTFVAKGEPLINYEISGNMIQSGTPTPDNPIIPQGTGERTGNLFDGSIESGGWSGSDGRVPSKSSNSTRLRIDNIFKIDAQKDYTITVFPTTLQVAVMLLDDENKRIADTGWSESNYQNISNAHGIAITTRKSNNTGIIVNDCEGIMISEGSTVPSTYIPYGHKIPISSASTTTPVYLGEVETTRKIKKLVLTGEEETWDTISGNAPYRIQLPDIVQTSDKNIVLFTSSHYRALSNNAFWNLHTTCVSWTFSGGVNNKCLVFRDTNQATLADFKTYLAQQYAAGTPVTVWYVLATEETGIVNEPLRKIGDYADTLSMEQAGVEIPTVNGSNILDVDTTLKPSNIYIEYK